MKKYRIVSLILALLMASVSFAACSGGPSEASQAPKASAASSEAPDGKPSDEPSEKDEIIIGCTFDYVSDFMALVVDGVQQYDDEHDNVKVIVTDANFDIPAQIASAENLITQGADAIIIKPVDSSSCQPISDMCKEAGVPLIAAGAAIDSPMDVFVGSDNFYAGMLQGEYIAEALGGEGKVALLLGELGLDLAIARIDGNKEALSKYPGIEIVDEQVAGWMRDEGVAKTENWLQSDIGQSINAIISNNDEMAIGASIACQENGRDDILIAGIDALDDALKLIDEGKLAFTVFYDGVTQGYTACQVAVELVNGKQVEKQVMIDFLPVDKSNVADYL